MSKKGKAQLKHRRSKRAAMRIAVFLHAVGIRRVCDGYDCRNWTEVLGKLLKQYESLPDGLRRQARDVGRKMIRAHGTMAIASELLSSPPASPPKPRPPRNSYAGQPKCPRSKSWDFKSVWGSRQAAEEFCSHDHDRGLLVYRCPFGVGWHIGHCGSHHELNG
jgi:hypothetical protein